MLSPPTLPSLLFPLGFFKDCSSRFSPKRSHHTFLWARFYCQSSSNISWTWRNQYCPGPTKAVQEKWQQPVSCCLCTSGWPVPIPAGGWWHTREAGRGPGGVPKCHIASYNSSAWIALEDFLGSKSLGFSVLLPGIPFPLLTAPKRHPEKVFIHFFPPQIPAAI